MYHGTMLDKVNKSTQVHCKAPSMQRVKVCSNKWPPCSKVHWANQAHLWRTTASNSMPGNFALCVKVAFCDRRSQLECACYLHHSPAHACVKELKKLVLSVCQFVSPIEIFLIWIWTGSRVASCCVSSGEHQHRLAHQCSPCEKFVHTWSVKLNIMGIWEWGL